MNILVFSLASERFAIPMSEVQRILQAVAVTRVPGVPAVVEGVVDVHGALTPVFDLRRRFGLPSREPTPDDHLVLAVTGGRTVLLHVDLVEELVEVDEARIQDPGTVVVGDTSVAGVAKLEDGLVLIHDLSGFLTEAESETLERALTEAATASQRPS